MGVKQVTKRFSCESLLDLPWYDWWLRTQLRQQPKDLYACVRDFDNEPKDNEFSIVKSLYSRVSDIILQNAPLSLDDIVQTLVEDETIVIGDEFRGLDSATNLVFSIIGLQTMLYRPDMLSCPPSELGIADEMDGHTGESHICLKQSRANSSKLLSDFLLGFGLMLPPKNYHILDDAEETKAFNRLKSVDSPTLNAHLLTTIGNVTVKWTDCLACHLELDRDSGVLYLFRYPSFCKANVNDRSAQNTNYTNRTVIHSCASSTPSNNHWATPQDVTELLEEVVLSYRLLFGQHPRSRKLFRNLRPFDHVPPEGRDGLLSDLCGEKAIDASLGIGERDNYELARDFPHLRTRLFRLSAYLDERKPRRWRELWLDNRDSASWLTFWAVILIGGIGLLLAFIQVVLQVAQIAISLRQQVS